MKKLLLLFVVCVNVTFGFALLADRPPLPPRKQDLVGVWIGYDKEYPDFYRLRLNNDNTGRLVLAWSQGHVDVYDVRWGVTNQTISLKASSARGSAPALACSVTRFNPQVMELQIKGPSNDWERVALLLNDAQLSKRNADTKKHDK